MRRILAVLLAVGTADATDHCPGQWSDLPDPATVERIIDVHDGDTYRLEIARRCYRVRLRGWDAPELGARARCPAEAAAAEAARAAAAAALAGPGPITLHRPGPDPYRRVLADIDIAGADLGRTLAAAGAVVRWVPGHPRDWCGAGRGANAVRRAPAMLTSNLPHGMYTSQQARGLAPSKPESQDESHDQHEN